MNGIAFVFGGILGILFGAMVILNLTKGDE